MNQETGEPTRAAGDIAGWACQHSRMYPNQIKGDAVTGRLAAYLAAHQEQIIDEWSKRLSGDKSIPTVKMSEPAIVDHLPVLLEDLTESLRQYGSLAVAEQTGEDAAKHGKTRWKQGFDLTALLREFRHLRAVLAVQMSEFENANADLTGVQRVFAASTVHSFLDAILIEASEQFCARQRPGAPTPPR